MRSRRTCGMRLLSAALRQEQKLRRCERVMHALRQLYLQCVADAERQEVKLRLLFDLDVIITAAGKGTCRAVGRQIG